MSQTAKLQRWIDLVTALLDRHYGATLAQLREAVPGYATGRAESVRRSFERDKDELRRLGVPIRKVGEDGDPEPRYVLKGGQFYLPYLSIAESRGTTRPRKVDRQGYSAVAECTFDEDELRLLGEAATRVAAMGDPMLAADASRALAKLAVDVPLETLAATPGVRVLPPRSRCDGEVLVRLGDALLRRKQVSFTYYGIERDETERRTVLPYGLAYTSGHWYLHAQDPSRGAVRLFRVSRIKELVVNPKSAGTPDYGIPETFHLSERAAPRPAWELGPEPTVEAILRFRGASGVVREAKRLGTMSRKAPDTARYQVRRREPFLRWVLGLAGEAEPISPPDIVREFHALVHRTLEAAAR